MRTVNSILMPPIVQWWTNISLRRFWERRISMKLANSYSRGALMMINHRDYNKKNRRRRSRIKRVPLNLHKSCCSHIYRKRSSLWKWCNLYLQPKQLHPWTLTWKKTLSSLPGSIIKTVKSLNLRAPPAKDNLVKSNASSVGFANRVIQ